MAGSNGKLFISMYHYTRDLKHGRYPKIKGLDADLFRKQMEFFKENFNVVRMEQVIEAVKKEFRYLIMRYCSLLMMGILIIIRLRFPS